MALPSHCSSQWRSPWPNSTSTSAWPSSSVCAWLAVCPWPGLSRRGPPARPHTGSFNPVATVVFSNPAPECQRKSPMQQPYCHLVGTTGDDGPPPLPALLATGPEKPRPAVGSASGTPSGPPACPTMPGHHPGVVLRLPYAVVGRRIAGGPCGTADCLACKLRVARAGGRRRQARIAPCLQIPPVAQLPVAERCEWWLHRLQLRVAIQYYNALCCSGMGMGLSTAQVEHRQRARRHLATRWHLFWFALVLCSTVEAGVVERIISCLEDGAVLVHGRNLPPVFEPYGGEVIERQWLWVGRSRWDMNLWASRACWAHPAKQTTQCSLPLQHVRASEYTFFPGSPAAQCPFPRARADDG